MGMDLELWLCEEETDADRDACTLRVAKRVQLIRSYNILRLFDWDQKTFKGAFGPPLLKKADSLPYPFIGVRSSRARLCETGRQITMTTPYGDQLEYTTLREVLKLKRTFCQEDFEELPKQEKDMDRKVILFWH